MKQKVFIAVFLSLFCAVGIGLMAYGFVRLAKYNSAEQVEATVLTAEYRNGEANVTFAFMRDGELIQTSAQILNVRYENGVLPYHDGAQVTLHVDGNNKVVQYDKSDIIVTVGGGLFLAFGAFFLYMTVLKKENYIDLARAYENAMVSPEELTDEYAKTEALADELSKLPARYMKRMTGEMEVGRKRFAARLQSFTVWENIVYGSLLIIPIILLSVSPLFHGKPVTFSGVLLSILLWLFVYAFGGLFLKAIHGAYIKLLVRCGRFSQRALATVVCSAFESSASFQTGNFSRTYTVYKKFRVIALVDGVRSVGYVKGNVPPPNGTVLRVLIRPHKLKRWIIDTEA